MESPIHTIPKRFTFSKKIYKYNFTFLNDIFKTLSVQEYYNLILSIEMFQLKNLYNFLYLRTIKLNRKFNTKILENNKYIDLHNDFNEILDNYIHKNKMYAFIL